MRVIFIGLFIVLFAFTTRESHALTSLRDAGNDTTHSRAQGDTTLVLKDSSERPQYNDSYRIAGGYGFGSGRYQDGEAVFCAGLEFTYQYLFHTITLRYVGTDALSTSYQKPDERVQEAALLYGVCISRSPFFCISAGVGWQKSLLWGQLYLKPDKYGYTMVASTTVGLALQGQLMFNFSQNFGMGFLFFENVNKVFTNGNFLFLTFEFGMF
jgi:hypothetical protein